MNMNKIDFISNLVAMDLETTGVDPAESEIIEIATVGVDEDTSLFRPEGGIPTTVSAITHLLDEDVAHEPVFDIFTARKYVDTINSKYVVCHNLRFEKQMLAAHGIDIPNGLCTLRMARKLYKDDDSIEAFNLPYLRYALDLNVSRDLRPHRALPDSEITLYLMYRMVDDMEKQGLLSANEPYFEQIEEWLNEPIWVETMPFGKHKGVALKNVPMSYWNWALNNMHSLNDTHSEYDPDLAASVFRAIESSI